MVIKPLNSRWNKKALKAARLIAKGKYKKNKKMGIFKIIFAPFFWLWNPLVAIVDGPEDMV